MDNFENPGNRYDKEFKTYENRYDIENIPTVIGNLIDHPENSNVSAASNSRPSYDLRE